MLLQIAAQDIGQLTDIEPLRVFPGVAADPLPDQQGDNRPNGPSTRL
jgi:hypothetical protein